MVAFIRLIFFVFCFFFLVSGVFASVSLSEFRFVIPSEYTSPSGGGGGSVVPIVGNCSSGTVFNGSGCVDEFSVSWRVVDDLVSSKVFVSLNSVKRVSFDYFVDSVPSDPLIVEGFLLVDGVSLPVFLVHEDVGRFVFDYDFMGFPDGVYDLVVLFDGHPKVLSLSVDSSNPLFASVLWGVGYVGGVFDGSIIVSMIAWVILGSLIIVGVLAFFLFKKGKSEDLVVDDVV